VTAVVLTGRHTDGTSSAQNRTTAADPTGPGLISYASATPSRTATPDGDRTSDAPSSPPATTAAPKPQDRASGSPAAPPKSPTGHPTSSAPEPSTTWRSVRSAGYPDRYWHVSGGLVNLDPVRGSESREDSTFKLVEGLADASCHSFATSDGGYLRHRQFVLRAERHDGSALFRQDATFCPRTSPVSGALMLESVNYPGRFLRHKDFRLRLDPYQHSGLYVSDASFQLVGGLA
jgi:hypothetical protein